MLARGQLLTACILVVVPATSVRALPELPRVVVDTTPVIAAGRTIVVSAGGDFQAALDSAALGDVIVLQAGATFTGPFTLPVKNGNGWITVQTSAVGALPAQGTRVSPSDAAAMPKLMSTSTDPVVRTAAGAHHYRFRGIEITTTATTTYVLANLDGSATYPYPAYMSTLAEVPHHLIIEQCYIHGTATGNVSRGVQLHSAHAAIIDSYISDIHVVGADTQAIGGWSGPGPFKIVNNYLAAAGENIMFGGALTSIPNLVASDIEIRRNHITKPLTWKVDDPSYAGKPWTIKNLLELKNAQRVLIDGNLFEYHWPSAQSGFSVMLTPRTEWNGSAWAMPWATVSNVTITNNVFRSLSAGIAISGRDDNPTTPGTGFLIRNNLFYDIGTPRWQVAGSFAGALFMLTNGINALTIQHNTSTSQGTFLLTDNADLLNSGLVYVDNIHGVGSYAAAGPPPNSIGGGVITQMFPGAVFTKNALIGPWPTAGGLDLASINVPYPGNFYPASLADVGFSDPASGNFRLTSASPYKSAATDGKDVGVDMEVLTTALTSTSTFTPVASSTVIGAAPVTSTVPSTSTTTSSSTSTTPSTSSSSTSKTPTSPAPATSTAPIAAPPSSQTTTPSTMMQPLAPGQATKTDTTAESDATRQSRPTRGAPTLASLKPDAPKATTLTTVTSRTTTSSAPASTQSESVGGRAAVPGPSPAVVSADTLSVIFPAANRTVTGSIDIKVAAPAWGSINRVDYLVDGALIAVTNPPLFTLPWNSAEYRNGPHTLTVRAYDSTGAITTATTSVTTNNNKRGGPVIRLTTSRGANGIAIAVFGKSRAPLRSIVLYLNRDVLVTLHCQALQCTGNYLLLPERLSARSNTLIAVITDGLGMKASQVTNLTGASTAASAPSRDRTAASAAAR